jgi:hypothetical protein
METENIKNTNMSGRKKTIILLIIIISVFLIYYSMLSIMSPTRELTALKNEFAVKHPAKSEIDERIYSDSIYLKLLKDKAFFQSKIAMAETDSIYLTINLSDSTANIEISGVVVHSAKMSHVQTSKILMKGNENIILSMLASPFTISNTYSTIRKEPVMIKMAPKDTSEYKPDIMPDTSLTEPVNYILGMTDGTRIYVYQEEKEKFSDRMSLFRFDIKDRLRETWRSLKSISHFKVPEYHLYIKLRLPRADAKIIYRALPKNGQIAVFW